MTAPDLDVAVVGAGIVGASCAWEAVQAGLRVGMFDGGRIGGGTTSTNMGQIVVEAASEAQFRLTRYSARLWAELAPTLPASVEFRKLGTLWLACREEELRRLEARGRQFSRHGIPAKVLDAESLRREEPQLRPGLLGGLLVPEDAVVDAAAVARELAQRIRRAGGEVHEGVRVTSFTPHGLQLEGGRIVTATHRVNAAGVGAPLISPGVPVRPRKGHLAYVRPPGDFVRHQLIEEGYLDHAEDLSADSLSFNVQPRPNGEIRIGSSRQWRAFDTTIDPGVVRGMLDRAARFVPGLAGLPPLRSEAGLRPASPDGLPLVGAWPSQEGVWLATGHEGLGITLSMATGRLLIDQLLGRRSEIPVAPYLPRRLGRMEAGRARADRRLTPTVEGGVGIDRRRRR